MMRNDLLVLALCGVLVATGCSDERARAGKAALEEQVVNLTNENAELKRRLYALEQGGAQRDKRLDALTVVDRVTQNSGDITRLKADLEELRRQLAALKTGQK